MTINEKYSNRNYTNFLKNNALNDLTDANGTTIVNTCFYHEGYPFLDMSKMGLMNITFKGCNLDNVIVPDNCTMIECSNRFIRVNSGVDWLCNKEGVFVEALND